jgi:hypothetical protein
MPDQIIKKLQFKNQTAVLILESPPEFGPVITAWNKRTTPDMVINKKKKYGFALCFVKTEKDVKNWAKTITLQLEEDAVLWMAYPKKSSKKYAAGITRDNGWSQLGELGYEGVSLVAIDEDWSALRFRKADKISTMIRRQEMAMSKTGKEKTANKTNKAIKNGKG